MMDYEIKEGVVRFSLAIDELAILANLVDEAMMELEDWEFSTRVGGERYEAEALHRQLLAASEELSAY